jgi:hypothetical protein
MQTFNEGEHQSTVEAVEQVGQSIEHQLHAEVQLLRQEIGELKGLLRGADGVLGANQVPR